MTLPPRSVLFNSYWYLCNRHFVPIFASLRVPFGLFLPGTLEEKQEIYESMLNDIEEHYSKTIKHLYLGKPFIHIDPIAHGLMKKNNMIPYKSLFTNELWDFYENFDTNTLLKNVDFTWCDLLIANFNICFIHFRIQSFTIH